MTEQPCCACCKIAYLTIHNPNGTQSERWECADCRTEFVRKGSVTIPPYVVPTIHTADPMQRCPHCGVLFTGLHFCHTIPPGTITGGTP